MIPKGLFTQIGMIIVSIGIIASYIRPEFADISTVQDDIARLRAEQAKVAEVNASLDLLYRQMNNVPETDRKLLFLYMPDTVDTIDVPRVLKFIAEESGVVLTQVTYAQEAPDLFGSVQSTQNTNIDTTAYPIPHMFSMSVEGTYGQLKTLLRLLETNEYPLEVRQLTVKPLDGGFLDIQMQIATYQHSPLEIN